MCTRRLRPSPPGCSAGAAEAWGWPTDSLDLTALRHGPHDLLVLATVDGVPTALVRAMRPGRMSATALESEAAWIRALGQDAVVRVPTVLPTGTGAAVAPLDGPRRSALARPGGRLRPRPAAVSTARRSSTRRSPEASAQLAARLHEHELAWQPPSWFRRPTIELRRPRRDRLAGRAAPVVGAAAARHGAGGRARDRLLGGERSDRARAPRPARLDRCASAARSTSPTSPSAPGRGSSRTSPDRSSVRSRAGTRPSLAAAWIEGYTTVRPWGDPAPGLRADDDASAADVRSQLGRRRREPDPARTTPSPRAPSTSPRATCARRPGCWTDSARGLHPHAVRQPGDGTEADPCVEGGSSGVLRRIRQVQRRDPARGQLAQQRPDQRPAPALALRRRAAGRCAGARDRRRAPAGSSAPGRAARRA